MPTRECREVRLNRETLTGAGVLRRFHLVLAVNVQSIKSIKLTKLTKLMDRFEVHQQLDLWSGSGGVLFVILESVRKTPKLSRVLYEYWLFYMAADTVRLFYDISCQASTKSIISMTSIKPINEIDPINQIINKPLNTQHIISMFMLIKSRIKRDTAEQLSAQHPSNQSSCQWNKSDQSMESIQPIKPSTNPSIHDEHIVCSSVKSRIKRGTAEQLLAQNGCPA